MRIVPVNNMMDIKLRLSCVANGARVPITTLNQFTDCSPSLAAVFRPAAFPAGALVAGTPVHWVSLPGTLFLETFHGLYRQAAARIEIGMLVPVLVKAVAVTKSTGGMASFAKIHLAAIRARNRCLATGGRRSGDCRAASNVEPGTVNRAKMMLDAFVTFALNSCHLAASLTGKRDRFAIIAGRLVFGLEWAAANRASFCRHGHNDTTNLIPCQLYA